MLAGAIYAASERLSTGLRQSGSTLRDKGEAACSAGQAAYGGAVSRVDRLRVALRWLLVAVYLLAGVLHLVAPSPFLSIVPVWVPFPRQVVLLTGLCEIAGAVGLMLPRWRRLAAVMLALYAICVFPANIKHAIDGLMYGRNQLGPAYHLPRLFFQPVIVWWTLFAGGIINWPFGTRHRT